VTPSVSDDDVTWTSSSVKAGFATLTGATGSEGERSHG
jgi:hypothetical protein